MNRITISWVVTYSEEVEVEDDWVWDGEVDSLLKLTDMPFNHPSGQLTDWGVQ